MCAACSRRELRERARECPSSSRATSTASPGGRRCASVRILVSRRACGRSWLCCRPGPTPMEAAAIHRRRCSPLPRDSRRRPCSACCRGPSDWDGSAVGLYRSPVRGFHSTNTGRLYPGPIRFKFGRHDTAYERCRPPVETGASSYPRHRCTAPTTPLVMHRRHRCTAGIPLQRPYQYLTS